MSENKKNLLIKIKALAERGEENERQSAQQFFNRILEKYGMTESDLDDEITTCEWFRYKEDLEKRLLYQILFMVLGHTETYKRTGGNFKLIGAYCTPCQKIEIEANYEFYKNALKKELKLFMLAFVNKNNLFPAKKPLDEQPPSDISKEELLKLEFMMGGMDKHILRKLIEGGSDNEND